MPGLERELAEPERRQRRQLGRLDHDRVAGRERRADLPARDVEREVPGRDQADDAERLAEGDVDAAGDGDRLAVVLVDGAGVEVEDLRHHADLAAGTRDRLAGVRRLEPRERLVLLLDERREAAEQAGAVGRSDGAPRREGGLRPGDGGVGLLDPGLLELGDRLLGGGIEDGQRHGVIQHDRGAGRGAAAPGSLPHSREAMAAVEADGIPEMKRAIPHARRCCSPSAARWPARRARRTRRPPSTERLQALDGQILTRLNATRAAHGLRPLAVSDELENAAVAHSRELIQAGVFQHDSPDGTSFVAAPEALLQPVRLRELDGRREPPLQHAPTIDADTAIQAWLDSPPHRENMLNPNWREVGIGSMHASTAGGTFGGEPTWVITMDFGARTGGRRVPADGRIDPALDVATAQH